MQRSIQNQASRNFACFCPFQSSNRRVSGLRTCRGLKLVQNPRTTFNLTCSHRPKPRPVLVLAFESGDEVEEDTMDRMEKCVASVKRSFNTIRAGRASPEMLDRISVDYYGAQTPLRQLAGISVPDNSMLVIQPYDQASVKAIERAIVVSDLGLTPNNDGKLIRLNIPQLTAERRKDYAKQASKLAEDGKVAIRNVRRDSMKALTQLKLGEDEQKNYETIVQENTDAAVKQVEEMLKKKQDELTTM